MVFKEFLIHLSKSKIKQLKVSIASYLVYIFKVYSLPHLFNSELGGQVTDILKIIKESSRSSLQVNIKMFLESILEGVCYFFRKSVKCIVGLILRKPLKKFLRKMMILLMQGIELFRRTSITKEIQIHLQKIFLSCRKKKRILRKLKFSKIKRSTKATRIV